MALAACGGESDPGEAGEAPPATTTETAKAGADTTGASEATTGPAPTTTEGAGGGSAGPSRSADPSPLPGLPAWTAGYRAWRKLNAKPLPERDPDPHRGTKNVFASKAAAEAAFPAGTVIVKEAFRPGADFVGLIAAMRKQPGRNPDHNDWVFIEWTRDAANEPFTELARGDVCTSCHVGASERDYVFTAG